MRPARSARRCWRVDQSDFRSFGKPHRSPDAWRARPNAMSRKLFDSKHFSNSAANRLSPGASKMKLVPVIDRFGAAVDPALPSLARCLDSNQAVSRLRRACPHLIGERAELRAIRVTRHKPGRRCVVEYDFEALENFSLVGKVRAKGLDKRTPQVLQDLRRHGFDANSADGISVPELAGVVPEFQMWLQVKVRGLPATEILP